MRDTNSLQDEIRVSRSGVSNLPFRKKFEYYWGYYKYYFFIILILALFLGNIIHGILTKKETVLSIAYINAFPNIEDEVFIDDFEKYLNLNPKKQEVILDSGFYIDDQSVSPYATTYHQKFSTRCMAGLLDVVVADEKNFLNYGQQGFFTDLRLLLSSEQMEYYKEALLYVDFSSGEKQVPVGINISLFPKITSTSSYPSSTAYFGIVSNSPHGNTALSYLQFLEQ